MTDGKLKATFSFHSEYVQVFYYIFTKYYQYKLLFTLQNIMLYYCMSSHL